MSQIFLSYRHVLPDEHLAEGLCAFLEARGLRVFLDKQIKVGLDWVAEIDRQLRASDRFVVLLSEASIRSDMVRQEIQTAYELRQAGTMQIFPVRLGFEGKLPYDLASYLNRIQYALWNPGDSETKLFTLLHEAIRFGEAVSVESLAFQSRRTCCRRRVCRRLHDLGCTPRQAGRAAPGGVTL